MSEIMQLYTNPTGLALHQAQVEDAEPELRCPNCECSTLAAEHCVYCGYDLISWAISLQQSNSIAETLNEMKLENGGY